MPKFDNSFNLPSSSSSSEEDLEKQELLTSLLEKMEEFKTREIDEKKSWQLSIEMCEMVVKYYDTDEDPWGHPYSEEEKLIELQVIELLDVLKNKSRPELYGILQTHQEEDILIKLFGYIKELNKELLQKYGEALE